MDEWIRDEIFAKIAQREKALERWVNYQFFFPIHIYDFATILIYKNYPDFTLCRILISCG